MKIFTFFSVICPMFLFVLVFNYNHLEKSIQFFVYVKNIIIVKLCVKI
jgi:hypothetical protein